MHRLEFIKALAATAATAVVPRFANGQQQAVPHTYTYKIAGGCEIKADVFGVDMSIRKPVIVYIHGGALIEGSRKAPPDWLDPEGEYVVVSIDYRLAPESKLPAIIQDIEDAFRWVREQGPRLFNIDSEKLGVAGGSAGAYLTLMSGFCISPRPRALLSLSGFGDINSSWQTQPSPFYLKQSLISKEVASASVTTACVSDPPEKNERQRFFVYCRQKGIWPKEISGHDPEVEPTWFDAYCPVQNVSAKYPPCVLIHGTADTDVPYAQSLKMDQALSRFKVEHRLLTVPGGPHVLRGFDPAAKALVFGQAVDYLKEHMT
jgi:acetyl esterase/lipase